MNLAALSRRLGISAVAISKSVERGRRMVEANGYILSNKLIS
jgi:hypothetical protein